MATKTFYATGTFKFANRMLTAGEPVTMDGPASRLYIHLGKITDRKPRAAAVVAEPAAPAAEPKPQRKAPARKRRAKAKP